MSERSGHGAPPPVDVTAEFSSEEAWLVKRLSFTSESEATQETLFALANGRLGVRGAMEERASPSSGAFLSDVFETLPISYHEKFPGFATSTDTRVPVADGVGIHVLVGAQQHDIASGEIVDFHRVLDLRAGRLKRMTVWRLETGETIKITAERIVPFSASALLAIRFQVTSIDYIGPISLQSSLDGSSGAAAQGDDPRIGAGHGIGLIVSETSVDAQSASLVQKTRYNDVTVVSMQKHRIPENNLDFIEGYSFPAKAVQKFSGKLMPGEAITIEKFVSYASASDGGRTGKVQIWNEADAEIQNAIKLGFDGLAKKQEDDITNFWSGAKVTIGGAPQLDEAIKFNLFHLFQSASRNNKASIAAKGLTGEGYEGHYFWDTEAYIFPVLAFTAPALARNALEFRFKTLDGARNHARELNHACGALYPWRTIAGGECSSYFPSGSAQYHINAAIAFAIELYDQATNDEDFMVRMGGEILFETARLWMDVGYFNPRRSGAFCIHEVTGPDEYSALVDNNFYTNLMAQKHLRFAAQVADRLKERTPHEFDALRCKIDLSDSEIQRWRQAANQMYLPYDAELEIHAQDDGFLDKPHWDFKKTPASNRPLLLHYHPLTIYRHQVCKQADVVLAMVLAGQGFDLELKRRNFDYYESITAHDSTLSASTFSILAAEIGYSDKALRYMMDTARVDLDDLHDNAAHGVHMAAMAGSWLSLTWGLAGLRAHQGALGFSPILPAPLSGYNFCLHWQGRQLRVSVNGHATSYELLSGAALEIAHFGHAITLELDSPQTCSNQQAPCAVNDSSKTVKAIIFDLDGVLTDTAKAHFLAWAKLADEIGVPFDEAFNEQLKGIDRQTSLDLILAQSDKIFSAEQKQALADRKNGFYLELISQFSPADVFPGVVNILESAKKSGLKLALASASRNAAFLTQRLGIQDYFDHIVDAAKIERSKPDPEIFLTAARMLGVDPHDCVGVEDAAAGVMAIKAAGMFAIAIGNPDILSQADQIIPNILDLNIENFANIATRNHRSEII